MKKWMIALVSVVAAVAILISGFFVYKNAHIKNVFDEMYYSEDRSFVKLTSASFWKADAIRNDKKNSVYINEGVSSFSLEHASLTPNEKFSILVLREESRIAWGYSLSTSNGVLHFDYYYEKNSKSFIMRGIVLSDYTSSDGTYHLDTSETELLDAFYVSNNITQDRIAYRAQGLLFNVLVPSWLEGNEGRTMFSETDLGTYTLNLP